MLKTKKLAISGMIIALYIVLMYFTQGFAFGQYQLRVATGLYAFAYQFPFLILPMGIANLLSNTLMGGLGGFDVVGGMLVGILTTSSIVILKKFKFPKWVCVLPIALIPSLCVPIWLSLLLHIPYIVLFLSILVGQVITAFTVGLVVITMKVK